MGRSEGVRFHQYEARGQESAKTGEDEEESKVNTEELKFKIRQYAMNLGVDDVGFANVRDYNSPRSPKIEDLFPSAQSIIVLAYRESSHCESRSPYMAMAGRTDLMEFSRSINYKLTRYLEKEFRTKAMAVPASYPLDMGGRAMGLIGEVSLRHAALAAGLGNFGRHNLIIHPRLGARVLFTAVLCELDLPSDPQVTEDLCTYCNICVDECPGMALDEEGKTDNMKCLRHSQPYGIGASIGFWNQLMKSSPEEQKKLLFSEGFMKMYQAHMIGFQYFCFNCFHTCPVGRG